MSAVEIRVYPNQLNSNEYERLGCDAGITLHEYLTESVEAYHARPVPLFSALLNGEPLSFERWDSLQFAEGDLVECMVEPKDPVTAVMVVIAVASAAYGIYLANQPLPDTYNGTAPKGSPIYDVNAQGNRPRLMGTVPVLFGRHKIFPDYLLPPRIEYINNEQVYYALLSVAAGSVSLNLNDIYIGDTIISKMGSDVAVQVFPPGADVSGNEAHRILYSSAEVGSNNYQTGLYLAGSMAADAVRWQISSADGSVSNDTRILEAVLNETDDGYGNPVYVYKDWTAVYHRYYQGSLIGKILELAGGTNSGLYRVVTDRLVGVGSRFHKLKSDLSIDPTWAGFVGQGDGHAAVSFSSNYRVLDFSSRQGWWFGPFLAVPDGATTNKIKLDFRFNEGLCYLDSNGVPQSRSVLLLIEYRDADVGGSYTEVSKTYVGVTLDQLAFTATINLPFQMRPEVRVRRVTYEPDDVAYKGRVEWTALRSELSSRASYPEFTTMAIRIRGSDVVSSGSVGKISCIPRKIDRAFDADGNLTGYRPTSAVADAVFSIAYDLGYSLDMDELGRLHKVWLARGDEFNAVFDNATTAWKALQQVLSVGFAEPTLDFGKIVPVRDEARTVLNYQYQADNILPNSWKMDGSFVDGNEHDGMEIEYFSESSWKAETVLCLLPGDAGNNPERVRAFGITDKTKAYQFGMRKRATQKHRRIRHTFSTEMDALNSRYMSYDALGIDMAGYSQTGRVESVSGRVLQLNQDLEWGAATHYIGIRRPDGTLSGPYQCSVGDDAGSVVINADLDFSPIFNGNHEPPYFMFGEADEWCIPVLVTEIKPTGTDKVKVTAYEYSDKVYLYDDAVPV